jgi:hypothetical protein
VPGRVWGFKSPLAHAISRAHGSHPAPWALVVGGALTTVTITSERRSQGRRGLPMGARLPKPGLADTGAHRQVDHSYALQLRDRALGRHPSCCRDGDIGGGCQNSTEWGPANDPAARDPLDQLVTYKDKMIR